MSRVDSAPQDPLIQFDEGDSGPHSQKSSDLVCVLALVRHGDRTCKQKIQLKFHGEIPTNLPMHEDIRSKEVMDTIGHLLSGDWRNCCKSDPGSILNAVQILSGEKDDLKLKIEPLVHTTGWVLKLKWGGTLTPLGITQSKECGKDFARHISKPCLSDIRAYSSTDTRCKETASAFVDGLREVADYSDHIRIRFEDGPDGLGSLEDLPFRHSPRVERVRSEISALLMNGSAISEELKDDLFPTEDYCLNCVVPGRTALGTIFTKYKSFSRAVSDLKVIIDEFVEGLGILSSSSSSSHQGPQFFLNESIGLVHARWSHIAKNFQKSYGSSTLPRSASASPRSRWKSVDGGRTQSGALFSSVQISLIGEIHDNAQYDYRHNIIRFDENLKAHLERIRSLSNLLSQVVTPSEHGLTLMDRTCIAATFIRPLIHKFRFDFRLATGVALEDESIYLKKQDETLSSGGSCRVRLYFAHHSHLISLINLVRSLDANTDFRSNFLVSSNFAFIDQIDLLGYLGRVVLRVYKEQDGRLRLSISVSKGDDFSVRDSTNFPIQDVLEAIFPSKESLDAIFTKWLSLAAHPESAALGPIGESTSENLE